MKYYRLLLVFIIAFSFNSCEENGEVTNFDTSISIEDLTVTESEENFFADVTISLSKASDKTISAILQTSNGTAIVNLDYSMVSKLIVFEPGQVSVSVSIEIIGDDKNEEEEFFNVRLTEPTNANLLKAEAQVIIVDNDEPRSLKIPEDGYISAESYDGMNLVWQDEFDEQNLNGTKWTHEIGTGSNGWGNNELQYYREENTKIVDGNLVIEARKEFYANSEYTSSRIVTLDKYSFLYGRVDIRAVLPEGQGIWPALWMLGENIKTVSWPACGELDIMEMIGGSNRENTIYGTAHWSDNGHASYGSNLKLDEGTFNDKFHVFSIEWNENSIKWFVDDKQFIAIDITPDGLVAFRKNFFFIFNIAVGGDWPGYPDDTTIFPQWMIVDYIRVFQTK